MRNQTFFGLLSKLDRNRSNRSLSIILTEDSSNDAADFYFQITTLFINNLIHAMMNRSITDTFQFCPKALPIKSILDYRKGKTYYPNLYIWFFLFHLIDYWYIGISACRPHENLPSHKITNEVILCIHFIVTVTLIALDSHTCPFFTFVLYQSRTHQY